MSNFEYRTTADIDALIKAQEVAEKYKAKNIKLGKSIRDTKRKAWFFPNTHEGARQDVAIYTQDKEVKEPKKTTKNYRIYKMYKEGKTLHQIADYFDTHHGHIRSSLKNFCSKWGYKINLPEKDNIENKVKKLYRENENIKAFEVSEKLSVSFSTAIAHLKKIRETYK